MHIKIATHLLPYEVNSFIELMSGLAEKYISQKDIHIYLDVKLNLSEHIIDWAKSQTNKDSVINNIQKFVSNLPFNINSLSLINTNEEYNLSYSYADWMIEGYDGVIFITPDVKCGNERLQNLLKLLQILPNKYVCVVPPYRPVHYKENDMLTRCKERYISLGRFDYYNKELLSLTGYPYPDKLYASDYYREILITNLLRFFPEQFDFGYYVTPTMTVEENRSLIDIDKNNFVFRDRTAVFNERAAINKQIYYLVIKRLRYLQQTLHLPDIKIDNLDMWIDI